MLVLNYIPHETIWGGTKLLKYVNTDRKRIGHLYSVYCREDTSNKILNGEYKNKTLNEVFPFIKASCGMQAYKYFPLTIALVDASDNLSIQVHPDNECAKVIEGEMTGKRESWFFLEPPENGFIYNGCKSEDSQEVEKEIAENRMEQITDTLEIEKEDYVFVEPGTLHAMTAGCLVYEIEEGSDYTYRFYDFDRKDQDGYARELHLEKALKSLHTELKSKSRKYPDSGIIVEETYTTRVLRDIKSYKNDTNILECFTLLKGNMVCENIAVSEGMTVLLYPDEQIELCDVSLAVVSHINTEE